MHSGPHLYPHPGPCVRMPFTERDALELADRIESHSILAEKLAFYRSHVQDPELNRLFARCEEFISRDARRLTSLLQRIQEQTDWNVYTHTEPRPAAYGRTHAEPDAR